MTLHWNIKPDTPEWHAVRLKHIGGSEIAGLFGAQPEFGQSAFTLHMVKSGRIPAPPVDSSPGTRIWYGKRMEPVIGSMAAELYGWQIRPGPYATDDTCPGMAASLDFIIDGPGAAERALGFRGPGVLQTKNSDFLEHARSWTNGQPPLWIQIQVQDEIACSGLEWGCIVCLVGGNELERFHYQARPRLADEIRRRIGDFWEKVRAGKPPQVDASNSTADALKELYPVLPAELPIDLTGDNELPEICSGWLVEDAFMKNAESKKQGYINRIREKMQGHRRAVTNGYAINAVVTPANPGRPAEPGEIIGKKSGSHWFKVKEVIEQ